MSYEVLQALYTVGSFSGCFATDLLTSHVVVLVQYAIHTFPLCDAEMNTYPLIHTDSDMHAKKKRFQIKETI